MPSKIQDAFIAALTGNEAFELSPDLRTAYEESPQQVLSAYEYWVATLNMLVTDYFKSASAVEPGFAKVVRATPALRESLVREGFDAAKIEGTLAGKRSIDQERIVHAIGLWVIDQKELLVRAVLERSIVDAFDPEGRAKLRASIGDAKALALEAERVRQNDELVFRLAVDDLGPEWKTKAKTSEALVAELKRRVDALGKDADKIAAKGSKSRADTGKEERLRRQVEHLKNVLLNLEFARVQTIVKDNPADLRPLLESSAGYATYSVEEIGAAGQRARRQGLERAVAERRATFEKQRARVDPKLKKMRDEVHAQASRVYAELLPLLDELTEATTREADLRAELMTFSRPKGQKSPAKSTVQLLDELRAAQLKVRDIRRNKDRLCTELSGLDARMEALAGMYTAEVTDEASFEDQARQQLALLETLPKVAKAMNVYCATYQAAFPIFLYVGKLVSGDGTVSEGDDLLDIARSARDGGAAHGASEAAKSFGRTVRDGALKLPLVGLAINDIEKAKAYDTGSLAVSLNLGLSYGVEAGVEASVGLALVYEGSLSHTDCREFETNHTLKLQAVGGFKIPKLIEATLTIDVIKYSGGFVFQDAYHWAAWMAAWWGRAIARLRAADLYMGKHNVGPNDLPSAETLAAIDEMASTLFEHDLVLRDVYKEIVAYLELPVIRTKALEALSGAALEVKALDDELAATLAVDVGETKVIVTRNEGGKNVSYVAEAATDTLEAEVEYGGYKLAFSASHTEGDVRTMTNGTVVTLRISPIPPPEFWPKLFDIVFGPVATGSDPLGEKLWKALKDSAKYLLTKKVLSQVKDYLLEFEKAAEVTFTKGSGGWVLMYVRTQLAFSKGGTLAVPVLPVPGLAIDVGASLELVRSVDEAMGIHSITYPLVLYVGLQRRSARSAPESGSSTLRPEKYTGPALWAEYVKKHKAQFWDIFVAIGNGEATVTRELEDVHAKAEARALVAACRAATTRGGFATPPLLHGVLSALPGFLPADMPFVQGLAVAGKTLAKTRDEFESKLVEGEFKAILPVFERWLAAELAAIDAAEASKPLRPLKRKVARPVAIAAKDARVVSAVADEQALARKTGKQPITCRRVLDEVHDDYATAEYLLSVALVPERYWVPDEAVSACMHCTQTFRRSVFSSNKHHCRVCGGIFCDKDSPSRAVPVWVSSSRIRVCPACEKFIAAGPGLRALVEGRAAKAPPKRPAARRTVVVQEPVPVPGPPPNLVRSASVRAPEASLLPAHRESVWERVDEASSRTTEIWHLIDDGLSELLGDDPKATMHRWMREGPPAGHVRDLEARSTNGHRLFSYEGILFRGDSRSPLVLLATGFQSRNDLTIPANLLEAQGLDVDHGVGATGQSGVSCSKRFHQALPYACGGAVDGYVYILDSRRIAPAEAAYDMDANVIRNELRDGSFRSGDEVNVTSIRPEAILGWIAVTGEESGRADDDPAAWYRAAGVRERIERA